jgi:hypothetical protein
MVEAIKGRYYQAIYGKFEDSLDAIGGIVLVGSLTILGSIAGAAYYLPLEDATKFIVWAGCGLAFLALAVVMLVWFVAVMIVGVGKGTRDELRMHRERVEAPARALATMNAAQRARYDELAAADARVRAMTPEEREAHYAQRIRPGSTGPMT